ncbi:LIC_12337 family protein [Leptospira terpstrae]|uniref:LIC_12337 family protein n=1 Tax=Leptospira terpstrae TaxID=293075 RepID=UPI003CFCD749
MKKVLYTFIFLGMSFQVSDFHKLARLDQEIRLTSLFSEAIQFGIGSEKIWSATSADNWGFVRQSATWARGNSGIIDSLILALKNAGYFNNSAPRNDVLSNVNLNGFGSATLTIKISTPTAGISSTAYTGTKTFNHFFEIKKTGASTPSLQLFFDDPETTLGNDGALVYYRLVDFGNPAFANVGDVITESYTGNDSIYGTKFQTYTWRNGPENSSWISKHGRVVLTEVDSGRQLCFRSVVRLTFTKLKAVNPTGTAALDNLKTVCNTVQGTGASDQIYYALAYMQKFDSPFQTTAKATFTMSTARPETICAIPESPSAPNVRLSYGIFNINGYVTDQLLAAQIPADYPSPTVGGADFMSVDEAFNRTYVAFGASIAGQAGLGTVKQYETTSKAFLDAFDGSDQNLTFK